MSWLRAALLADPRRGSGTGWRLAAPSLASVLAQVAPGEGPGGETGKGGSQLSRGSGLEAGASLWETDQRRGQSPGHMANGVGAGRLGDHPRSHSRSCR